MRANLKRWIPLGVLVAALDQGTKLWVTSLLEHGDRVQVLPFLPGSVGITRALLSLFWPRRVDGSVGFYPLGIGLFALRHLGTSALERARAQPWLGLWTDLGGAVGNLIDRIVHGHVVDFVLVHYQQHIFPAFNVADSALFCGVVLWAILLFQQYRQEREANSQG